MSNLPDGFWEPRQHDDRCAALCDDDTASCALHTDHDCTCDAIHEQDAEREAEAILYMDATYQQYLADHNGDVDATVADLNLSPIFSWDLDPALTEEDDHARNTASPRT